jgi:hypothetical protein
MNKNWANWIYFYSVVSLPFLYFYFSPNLGLNPGSILVIF